MKKKKIFLFSTYTEDKIIDEHGIMLKKQPGGPLLFIKKALNNTQVNFISFHGENIKVLIKITKNGEQGRVITTPSINPLPVISADGWIIISTVFKEWNLENISKTKNKIFLDIQGYVRNIHTFGKKALWKNIEKYAKNIYCMKGTKEEVSYVPKNVYENQKKRLLIITDGKNGVEWFFKGKKYFIPVNKKIKSLYTIGAGDTFFGYFIGYLYKRKTIKISLEKTCIKTENFLKESL